MELRVISRTGREKNIGVMVKTDLTSLNIVMEEKGKKITASFKRGTDFQKALGESKELARKYFFNED